MIGMTELAIILLGVLAFAFFGDKVVGKWIKTFKKTKKAIKEIEVEK